MSCVRPRSAMVADAWRAGTLRSAAWAQLPNFKPEPIASVADQNRNFRARQHLGHRGAHRAVIRAPTF
jgi:hypothetical protein